MKQPCVYILASKRNGTLYTGVTSHLSQRIYQQKNHLVDSFTKKYDVTKLVWYELLDDMYSAITREKQIKAGSRSKNLALIQKMNPDWKDLYKDII